MLRTNWRRVEQYSVQILSVLVLTSFLISAYVLNEQSDLGRESRERLCAAAQSNRTAMWNVLEVARDDRLSQAKTPDEAEHIADYYRRVLRLVPPLVCDQLVAP